MQPSDAHSRAQRSTEKRTYSPSSLPAPTYLPPPGKFSKGNVQVRCEDTSAQRRWDWSNPLGINQVLDSLLSRLRALVKHCLFRQTRAVKLSHAYDARAKPPVCKQDEKHSTVSMERRSCSSKVWNLWRSRRMFDSFFSEPISVKRGPSSAGAVCMSTSRAFLSDRCASGTLVDDCVKG